MPKIRYSADQLKQLSHSPLVRKPDGLPAIDQWFETSSQARGKIQNGKTEEGDVSSKRPSLFEHRQRAGHSQSGVSEDFLGPRSSFASLSAARYQSNRTQQDSGIGEGNRSKNHRFGEKLSREKEIHRRHDVSSTVDSEPRSRFRRGSDADEDRNMRHRVRHREDEGDNMRRSGMSKDTPWSRDHAPSRESDNWREKPKREESDWHREAKAQEAPWSAPNEENSLAHRTAEDLQAFMKRMRAGAGSQKDSALDDDDAGTSVPLHEAQPKTKSERDVSGGVPLKMDSVFGSWGDVKQKAEPKVEVEPIASKAAASKSSKKSRFFPGAPGSSAPVPELPEEPVPQSAATPPPPSRSVEDKQGFERMMAMLRMGGNTPRNASKGIASPPPGLAPNKGSAHGKSLSGSQDLGILSTGKPHEAPSGTSPRPNPPSAAGNSSSRPASSQPHSHAPSRDSEFLMNLMRQSASISGPRTPFNEAQIYGQSYGRPNSQMSNFSPPPPPPQPPSRGPPPSMFPRMDNGYPNMPNVDVGAPNRGQTRPPPHEEYRNIVDGPYMRFDPGMPPPPPPPGMLPFEEQQGPGRRPSGIPPPPGFAAGRGQPLFGGYPPNMNPQQGPMPPRPMPPSMHQQLPPQPPGFFNAPPPGLGQHPSGRGKGPEDPRARGFPGQFPGGVGPGPMPPLGPHDGMPMHGFAMPSGPGPQRR